MEQTLGMPELMARTSQRESVMTKSARLWLMVERTGEVLREATEAEISRARATRHGYILVDERAVCLATVDRGTATPI
jgi:hypothetical protein